MPFLEHFQTLVEVLRYLENGNTPLEEQVAARIKLVLADDAAKKAAEAVVETLHKHPKDLELGVKAALESLDIIFPCIERTLKSTFPGRDPKKQFLRTLKILFTDTTFITHIEFMVRDAMSRNTTLGALMGSSLDSKVYLIVQFVARLKTITLDNKAPGPNTEPFMAQVNTLAQDLLAGFVQDRIFKAGTKIVDALIFALPSELSDVKKADISLWFRTRPMSALKIIYQEEECCFTEIVDLATQPPGEYRVSTAWLSAYFEDEECDIKAWARQNPIRVHTGRVADILVMTCRKLVAFSLPDGSPEAKEHWKREYGDDKKAVLDEVVRHTKKVKMYLLGGRE